MTCLHIEIERTPGYGHCIVRCASCHKPAIRVWDRHKQPIVTWTENIETQLPRPCDQCIGTTQTCQRCA